MKEIKLVSFDLDGTLLDDGKNISDENMEALELAKSRNIHIVPATGRLNCAVPEALKKMCRYFMLINGAQIYDSETDSVIYSSYISWDRALQIYEHAETLPCIYDAYINDMGCMSRRMWDVFADYMVDKSYAVSMRKLRIPVPDLMEKLIAEHCDVQKAQYFFKDLSVRDTQLEILKEMFPELNITVSLGSNIEINSAGADKGKGLKAVCGCLGIDTSEAAAFGDGTNDLAMLIEAGTGVCMLNGDARCKEAADMITQYDNNSSGFGIELKRLLKN